MSDLPDLRTPCCSVNELKDAMTIAVVYECFPGHGTGERITRRKCNVCGQVWEVRYQMDIAAGSSLEWRKVTP